MRSFDALPQPDIPPQDDRGGEFVPELAQDAEVLDGRAAQAAMLREEAGDTPLPSSRHEREHPDALTKTAGRAATTGTKLDMCGTIEQLQERIARIEQRIEDKGSFNPFTAIWASVVLRWTGGEQFLEDYRSGRMLFDMSAKVDRQADEDGGDDRNRSAGAK